MYKLDHFQNLKHKTFTLFDFSINFCVKLNIFAPQTIYKIDFKVHFLTFINLINECKKLIIDVQYNILILRG